MKLLLACSLSLRYLGLNARKTVSNARKSLFGAIWGIGISIVPLVIVSVVADGMIKGISSRMIELGTGHIQILDLRPPPQTKESAEARFNTATALLDSIKERQLPGITGMWVQQEGTGLLIGPKGRSGGKIRAIEPDYFTANKAANQLLTLIDGSLSLTDPRSVLLGKKIAELTGLKAGDTCTVLTVVPTYRDHKDMPRLTRLTVAGIISSGYQDLDALWICMPLATGRTILSPQASYTALLVSTADAFKAALVSQIARTIMPLLPAGFSLYTWKDLNRSQFYSFETSKNLLLFIMFLILFVASINISSAMIMLIMERRKEIAILKTTGAHPFFITFSFLLAGLLTATAGLVIGLAASLPLALHINELFLIVEYGINYIQAAWYYLLGNTGTPLPVHLLDPAYYLEHIPISIPFDSLYAIAAGTLILSIIVCMIPAIQAGREKPLDSMRKL